VTLEIVPSIYSRSIIQENNRRKTQYSRIDFDFFCQESAEMPPRLIIKEVFGGELIGIESYLTKTLIRDCHLCDIYGIDEEKFIKIIAFIDSKIIVKFNFFADSA
jgi:hypothetical protein